MTTECPPADGSAPKTQHFDGPPPMCIDLSKRYTAEMVTSKGTMVFALDAVSAPRTTNNFVFLARYHYFDGISFHRIIPNFVLQGGDPQGNGTGGPGYRFEDELPKPGRYEVGSLAMANAGPTPTGASSSSSPAPTARACHRSTRCSARSSPGTRSSPSSTPSAPSQAHPKRRSSSSRSRSPRPSDHPRRREKRLSGGELLDLPRHRRGRR